MVVMVTVGGLLCNCVGTGVFIYASRHNYPGGVALGRLHGLLEDKSEGEMASLYFSCKQVGRALCFVLDKLLCMIVCFILITKQLISCEYYKESLHTHKLAWRAERVNSKVLFTAALQQSLEMSV